MTKEEILEENGAHLHDVAYQYSVDTEDLKRAMDQYAKERSIAFAEFIFKGGYTCYSFTYEWMWVKKSLYPKSVSTLLTTRQLYDEFIFKQTKE